MMNQVRCADCQYFLVDTVGLGDGIGRCAELEVLLSASGPDLRAIDKFRDGMGRGSLYPNRLRFCVYFIASVGKG